MKQKQQYLPDVEYNETFFCSRSLKEIVPFYIDVFKKIDKRTRIDAILSVGSSGASIASAILMGITKRPDLRHISVPKTSESRHSDNGHYQIRFCDIKRVIIVDDFIESGKAMYTIIKWTDKLQRDVKVKIEAIIVHGSKRQSWNKRNIPVKELIRLY